MLEFIFLFQYLIFYIIFIKIKYLYKNKILDWFGQLNNLPDSSPATGTGDYRQLAMFQLKIKYNLLHSSSATGIEHFFKRKKNTIVCYENNVLNSILMTNPEDQGQVAIFWLKKKNWWMMKNNLLDFSPATASEIGGRRLKISLQRNSVDYR